MKKFKPNALAFDIKQAAKCGCNSNLPTDTDWDAVMSDRRTNRFFEDKTCKGINHYIEKQMLGARIRKPKH